MSNSRNIVMIGTLDTRGGAARVSWMLGEELRKRGHTVDYFVGWKHSEAPHVHEIPKNPFYYRLSQLFATDLRFSRSNAILERPEYKKADIIHCHNIHSGFFNWSTFGKIVKEKKVVWTIHDLWPITSGCTTAYQCKESKPRKVLGFLWDNNPHILKRKENLYKNSFFHTVAPSTWLGNKIKSSILGSLPNEVIYNPIDTTIFKSYEKSVVRKELKLPQDKKIILFVAPKGMNDTLKGSDLVSALAAKYKDKNDYVFIGIGGKVKESRENIISVGHIDDPVLLAKYYNAADVFLYPSRADSFGLVVAEAMACGVPSVVVKTDALPEIVGDSRFGYIANPGDVEDLDRGLQTIFSLSSEDYRAMSQACRERAEKLFSLNTIVNQYLNLYEKIIQ